MKVPYTEHVTNETILTGVQGERRLLASVKCHKLRNFGHTVRHKSLAKDTILGPIPGEKYAREARKKTMVRRDQRVDRSHHPRPGLPGTR